MQTVTEVCVCMHTLNDERHMWRRSFLDTNKGRLSYPKGVFEYNSLIPNEGLVVQGPTGGRLSLSMLTLQDMVDHGPFQTETYRDGQVMGAQMTLDMIDIAPPRYLMMSPVASVRVWTTSTSRIPYKKRPAIFHNICGSINLVGAEKTLGNNWASVDGMHSGLQHVMCNVVTCFGTAAEMHTIHGNATFRYADPSVKKHLPGKYRQKSYTCLQLLLQSTNIGQRNYNMS